MIGFIDYWDGHEFSLLEKLRDFFLVDCTSEQFELRFHDIRKCHVAFCGKELANRDNTNENFVFIHDINVVNICFLKLNDLVVELYEHKNEAVRKEVAERVTGVYDHFAIDAADFDDYAARLINKGLTLAAGTAEGVVLYENIKSKGTNE